MSFSSWRFNSSPGHMETRTKKVTTLIGGIIIGIFLVVGGTFAYVKYRSAKLAASYLESRKDELALEKSRKEQEKTSLEQEISTLEQKTTNEE